MPAPWIRPLHKAFFGACVLLGCALPAWQCATGSRSLQPGFDPDAPPARYLSEYGFFAGEAMALAPASGVLPYELISPLFSDYAEKTRFVYLPPGTQAEYQQKESFEFPVGTALVKTFWYPRENGQKHLVETRLLLKRADGWDALPYRWNAEGTDAELSLAGGRLTVEPYLPGGNLGSLDYVIPNKNQCKGCHSVNGKFAPIGPKARNLNRPMDYGLGAVNQLDYWQQAGILAGLPEASARPALADYRDTSQPLDDRAIAYLEINCGHCHRPEGPANTSGLHLTSLEKDPARLGFCKSPVAAGKGSGGLRFDIHPGQPDSSILVYRMEQQNPGVRMPELGRQLLHQEGVALIRQWIAALPGDCSMP